MLTTIGLSSKKCGQDDWAKAIDEKRKLAVTHVKNLVVLAIMP